MVTEGKTLMTKGKTLVTKGKTLVTKGKTLVTGRMPSIGRLFSSLRKLNITLTSDEGPF